MALESLPPDQRAVIQLVLQQGRSYADLAGLLGISDDAVRRRAWTGLSTLGPAGSLAPDEQGLVADYLLGQQDAEGQAATHALLERSQEGLAWARSVSEELRPVARHGLPELPEAGAPAAEPQLADPEVVAPEATEPEPEADAAAVEPTPEPSARRHRRVRPSRGGAVQVSPTEPVAAPETPLTTTDADPGAEPEAATVTEAPTETEAATSAPRARRERRRPRRGFENSDASVAATAAAPGRGRPSSRLGGLLLLGGLALLAAFAIVYLVNRNDDEPSATNTTSTEASASPTATPQPLAQLPLKGVNGSKAEGLVQITASPQGQVGFTLVARRMAATQRGKSAYAIWLVDRKKPPIRLGFGEVLENQGNTLAVEGPEPKVDPAVFTRGLTTYTSLVVSRERSSDVTTPQKAVLRGSLKSLQEGDTTGGDGN